MIPAIGLLTAAGIGLLIGLERGWRQRTEHAGGRIAGIRTFSLIALGGGLAGEASTELSPWIGVVGIAAIGAALLLAHRARLNEPDDNVSATNVVVGGGHGPDRSARRYRARTRSVDRRRVDRARPVDEGAAPWLAPDA